MKRLTPSEWCEIFGVEMIDPDGWRDAGISYDFPLTAREFFMFFNESTARIADLKLWQAWKKFFA